jgi:hypothetical protein
MCSSDGQIKKRICQSYTMKHQLTTAKCGNLNWNTAKMTTFYIRLLSIAQSNLLNDNDLQGKGVQPICEILVFFNIMMGC